jgi:hypothetical protein
MSELGFKDLRIAGLGELTYQLCAAFSAYLVYILMSRLGILLQKYRYKRLTIAHSLQTSGSGVGFNPI